MFFFIIITLIPNCFSLPNYFQHLPAVKSRQGCPPSKVLGRAILVRGVAKLVRALEENTPCLWTRTGIVGDPTRIRD